MTRSELLHAAEVCVCGQREEDYGTPEDSFRVIGELWETYIKEKCVGDPAAEVCIVPEDVAALLALLKIARIATGHGKSDNWVDLAGYAACAASCRPWTANDWRARTSCGCRRSQRCSVRKEQRTGHRRTQMRHSWSCSARSAAA